MSLSLWPYSWALFRVDKMATFSIQLSWDAEAMTVYILYIIINMYLRILTPLNNVRILTDHLSLKIPLSYQRHRVPETWTEVQGLSWTDNRRSCW
jgi:hypothetical protein